MGGRCEVNGGLEVCFVFKVGDIRACFFDNWNNNVGEKETCQSEVLRWARKD